MAMTCVMPIHSAGTLHAEQDVSCVVGYVTGDCALPEPHDRFCGEPAELGKVLCTLHVDQVAIFKEHT